MIETPTYTEQDLLDAYAQGWSDCVDEMSTPWTGNLKPIRWMGGNRAEWYVEHLRKSQNPTRDE